MPYSALTKYWNSMEKAFHHVPSGKLQDTNLGRDRIIAPCFPKSFAPLQHLSAPVAAAPWTPKVAPKVTRRFWSNPWEIK